MKVTINLTTILLITLTTFKVKADEQSFLGPCEAEQEKLTKLDRRYIFATSTHLRCMQNSLVPDKTGWLDQSSGIFWIVPTNKAQKISLKNADSLCASIGMRLPNQYEISDALEKSLIIEFPEHKKEMFSFYSAEGNANHHPIPLREIYNDVKHLVGLPLDESSSIDFDKEIASSSWSEFNFTTPAVGRSVYYSVCVADTL